MTASSAPTSTVSSSFTEIDRSVPDTGAGISVSTLSVETSRSGSSAVTSSPTDFSQRGTVPSVTLSPSAGMVPGVPWPPPPPPPADDGELGADLDRLVLGDQDLAEDAGGRRGDLGVDLVGRDLEERLVDLD